MRGDDTRQSRPEGHGARAAVAEKGADGATEIGHEVVGKVTGGDATNIVLAEHTGVHHNRSFRPAALTDSTTLRTSWARSLCTTRMASAVATTTMSFTPTTPT